MEPDPVNKKNPPYRRVLVLNVTVFFVPVLFGDLLKPYGKEGQKQNKVNQKVADHCTQKAILYQGHDYQPPERPSKNCFRDLSGFKLTGFVKQVGFTSN